MVAYCTLKRQESVWLSTLRERLDIRIETELMRIINKKIEWLVPSWMEAKWTPSPDAIVVIFRTRSNQNVTNDVLNSHLQTS